MRKRVFTKLALKLPRALKVALGVGAAAAGVNAVKRVAKGRAARALARVEGVAATQGANEVKSHFGKGDTIPGSGTVQSPPKEKN